MCKSWCELIIAIVLLVFTLVSALWDMMFTRWIIVIAAIVLAIHSFTCKTCFVGHDMSGKEMKKSRRR